MCREIDFVINNINNALKFISDNLKTVFNTLSKDIPLIPTDIPKVAELVESTYTNYQITDLPQIQNISLSCPITIPLSTITTQVNNATNDINTQLNNIINKINNNTFFTAIDDIQKQINSIRDYIGLINFKQINNINIDNILDIIKNKILDIINLAEEEAKKIIAKLIDIGNQINDLINQIINTVSKEAIQLLQNKLDELLHILINYIKSIYFIVLSCCLE
jgi:hypothetical protein